MYYMEVLVGEASYYGTGALTYSAPQAIPVGSYVLVPLKTKTVPGIVTKNLLAKPRFIVKTVTAVPDLPPLPGQLLKLLYWTHDYYPAPLGTIVQQFIPRGVAKKPVPELSPLQLGPEELPTLTHEQRQVINAMEPSGVHILHGSTGSGKTRVYIELALKSIRDNKSAIILTPEIGLTSQLAKTFRDVFGERVLVLHSQLTEATRRRLWVTALQETQPLIIIGPRSALFSPLRSLGLIIVDEAHETAYKQDKSPYYQTSHVAAMLATIYHIPLVLGSATPSVADYYFAEQKKRPILRMTQTASRSHSDEVDIHLVDLRDRESFKKKSFFSDVLIEKTLGALERHEQVLLFLNRRGTARVILCDTCGWQALCPHCDTSLVYHGDTHTMRCHSCSFFAHPPASCPECHNTSVIFKSIGTKAIFETAQTLFPNARIQRFDTDNAKAERIEQHYESIKNGDIDILVGTQTLAKGLDLPHLSLVGVIAADTSLYMPDFSSQERTYQLINQVVGRVGRGHLKGTVIIQTYNPTSPVLKSIIVKDWQDFYTRELAERREFLFPPFCYLLKLWCRRSSGKTAQTAADSLVRKLKTAHLNIRIEGPAPAFHEKIQNHYQWQIIVKAKQRSDLIKIINQLPANWYYDIDPMNLL